MEDIAVDGVEKLAYKLRVVLFAEEEGKYWFEQLCMMQNVPSIRLQHSASWQMEPTKITISSRMSSSLTPEIIILPKYSISFSLFSKMSVQSLPILELLMIPNNSRHIYSFFDFVITSFIILSLITPFMPWWIYGFLDDFNMFLHSFNKVQSSLLIARSMIL